jgi:hypothetical protein
LQGCFSPKDGSGTQLKVVEGLAAGRPVFIEEGARLALPPSHEKCVFPLDPITLEILSDDVAYANARREARTYYDKYLILAGHDKIIAWVQSRNKKVQSGI